MSSRREGFGLIEVIIAMLILTVGILAMGGATGYILNQVRASELRTERMLAVREVSERLRAIEWEDLPAACQSQTFTVDPYSVTCALSIEGNMAHIQLVNVGPGFSAGHILTDTLMMAVARPVQ
jgi:prepilin-type N-terminal cleavage/methylation domain-containing protein